MTRLSQYLLPTEKEAPADAEALSHKLLVRAGLARQLGSGLWSWLPAGWRVHENVSQIIREELDAIGAQEMLMPVLNPAEIWQRSGRRDDQAAVDPVLKELVELGGTEPERRVGHVREQGKPGERRKRTQPYPEPR